MRASRRSCDAVCEEEGAGRGAEDGSGGLVGGCEHAAVVGEAFAKMRGVGEAWTVMETVRGGALWVIVLCSECISSV